eukprot:RCo001634
MEEASCGAVESTVAICPSLEIAFAEHAQQHGERVPADSVVSVLRSVGVDITEQQLEETVAVVLGRTWQQVNESEGLTMDEMVEVVASLKRPPARTSAEVTQDADLSDLSAFCALAHRLLCCKKHRGRANHNIDQDFEKGMKPTTRLLIVIVVIALVIALSVAGLAIGLSWAADVQSQKDALRKELDLVMAAVQSFSVTQGQAQEAKSIENTAAMLVDIIHQVGYKTNLQTTSSTMLSDAQVTALLLDHHHDLAAKAEVQQMASNLGAVVDELGKLGQSSLAVQLMDTLNTDRLPEGHEIMLASPGTGLAVIETRLKYSSLCPQNPCNVSRGPDSPVGMALAGKSGSFVGTDYTNRSVYGGYTFLAGANMALVYKINLPVLRERFLNETLAAIDTVNAKFQGAMEIMVQQKERPGQPLTVLKMSRECPHECGLDRAGTEALTRLHSGQTATAIDTDYRGTLPVVSVAAALGSMNGSLLFEIDVQ